MRSWPKEWIAAATTAWWMVLAIAVGACSTTEGTSDPSVARAPGLAEATQPPSAVPAQVRPGAAATDSVPPPAAHTPLATTTTSSTAEPSAPSPTAAEPGTTTPPAAAEPSPATSPTTATGLPANTADAASADTPPAADPTRDATTEAAIDTIDRKVGNRDPSPIPTLPRRKWFRHKLAPRERIPQVAYRYGVDEVQLREWNGLPAHVDRLKLGSRVKVHTARTPPHRERVTYTVVEGDTWWSVGLRHGVDGRDLRAYNYPPRHKMTPGTELQLWIDPIVFDWITAGGDPLPDDKAFALRRGGIGIGPPDDGRLLNGVRIPKGAGYHLRLPKSAYGTSYAVAQVMIALTVFDARGGYTRDLEIGAMSRPRGGELKGHKSHQTGRDLDIRLPRRAEVAQWRELTRRRIDWAATWELLHAMLRTNVRAIFLDYAAQKQLYRTAKAAGMDPERLARVLQYPDGHSAAGIVRHSPGHEKHLHVRFGCGPYEVECVP